ncbi:prepilin-type N-terminal cleavage/methylation domain-containing protein [Deinococcus pimensis]|uniref:prepilin-type N-terminal cleavage/methylation domain-containing protein n=1 Tax=Deinococcus pimensis TaxID=309888 RepID=UPI0004865CAA|nr:prepilin-type N-terminal cleavage/methylation domain-containing protein [Deinococcus pimensis]
MQRLHQGFTLLEVLVAMGVFVASLLLMNLLMTNLQLNTKSKNTISVNQAGQEYLERITNVWRNTDRYGILDASTTSAKYTAPPLSVSGYTWEVTACAADTTSFTTCTAAAAVQPSGPSVNLNTAKVVLLTVEYKKTSSSPASGQTFKATMGVARP